MEWNKILAARKQKKNIWKWTSQIQTLQTSRLTPGKTSQNLRLLKRARFLDVQQFLHPCLYYHHYFGTFKSQCVRCRDTNVTTACGMPTEFRSVQRFSKICDYKICDSKNCHLCPERNIPHFRWYSNIRAKTAIIWDNICTSSILLLYMPILQHL